MDRSEAVIRCQICSPGPCDMSDFRSALIRPANDQRLNRFGIHARSSTT
ncbi:hypothetical protein RRSWK_03061 [Rhodopirellula sp. SWK7]|nr:hypothetical protein RRSWK_03061 [Rhodopirellula sp. SWK7]